VLNDSRVIPARLFARRANARGKQEPSGLIEVLLTAPDAAGNWNAPVWRVLVRPGRKVRLGDHLEFHTEGAGAADRSGLRESVEGAGAFRPLNQPPAREGFSPGNPEPLLRAEVLSSGEFGERTLRFAPVEDFFATIEQIGHMPLPPYIKREDANTDRERYQTVFAQHRGSVAAPTAGLHFTPSVLEAITARGVETAKVTLHVGLGTFAPLRVEQVDEIHLHSERYTLSTETANALNRARNESRRIVAVGTTTVRTLEHVAQIAGAGPLQPHTGETSIFISPGYEFRIVDAMLTNFHLPQSSLLMLVSAFAGRERVLAAYAHAVHQQYRFFSYGDCMFLS
jgi:S-adenosylmethionine:tRNA ribosyltransferase-isomerase